MREDKRMRVVSVHYVHVWNCQGPSLINTKRVIDMMNMIKVYCTHA